MTITGETKTISPSAGPPPTSTAFSRPSSVSSRLSSTGSPKNSPKLSTNKKFTSSLSTDDPFFGPQRNHSSSSVSSLDFGPTPSPTTPTSRASKTSPRTSRLSSHMYEDTEKIPPKSGGGYDRLKKEESNPSSSALTFSYDSVEKRIKSPSPKDKSPPLSPALTEKEIKHIKKYNKEPLINKSETVHHRRNAEYNYIDIPQSETSSECGSIDSRPSSSLIYDTPTSRPLSNADPSDRSSLYDVPPPPRPLFLDTYDVPRSSVVLPPSSTPITSRALPHLPNDYVNMRPQGNGFVMEDLYSVIPERGSLMATNATVSQSQPVDGTKETGELPGQKLAQEMAEEEGYILVNPATLPALVSPPPTSHQSLSRSDSKTPPLEMDNEYIEVRRQPTANTAPVSSGLDVPVSPNNPPPIHHYINVPSRSPSQRKGTNPYEEITEVRPVLLMKSGGIGIETLTISPSPTVKEEASTQHTNNNTYTDSMISTDAVIDNSSVVAGVDDVIPKATSETRTSATPLSEPVEPAPPPITARVSRSVVSDTINDCRNTTQYHNVSITGTINSKLSSSTASTDEPNDENKVKTDSPPLNSSLSVPEETLSNPLEEDDRMECSSGHVETVTPEEEMKGYLTQDSLTSSLTDSLTPVTSLSSNILLSVGETHRSVSAPIPLSKSLVPVAQGSPDALHVSHRKRSLTSGDPLESPQYKEPSKKHTYVNVPAEFVPISPSPSSPRPSGTIKKPMPLPRPGNISIISTGIGSCGYGEGKDTPSCLPLAVNSNCSNNNMYSSKVRALIRQFSS